MAALPFVVEFAPAIVGVLLLMLLWAARPLIEALTSAVIARIPVIGAISAGVVSTMVADMEARANTLADAAVTPLAESIAAVPFHLTQIGYQIIACAWAIVFYIERIAIGAASTAAGAAVGGLSATLAAITASMSLMINQLIPQLQASILSVAEQARLRLDDLTGRMVAVETAIEAGITDALDAALVAVYQAITAAEARAIQAARGIEAGILDTAARQIEALRVALAPRVDAMERQVGVLTGELEGVLPGIQERIGAIEGVIPATGTQVRTLEETLTRYLDECGNPICDQYKPDIPNLQAAFQILETGLLAAWVTDAIADPRGAARRHDAIIVEPIGTVVGAFVSVAR